MTSHGKTKREPMDFKDYYQTLGVDAKAPQDVIKRAYRKLARKYHPDVSKEPDAESRFKEVAEAHEALIDPERRAAYDDLAARHAQARARGQAFEPPPGWDNGYEFSGRGDGRDSGHSGARGQGAWPGGEAGGEDFSAFFESLFGSKGRAQRGRHGAAPDFGAQDAPTRGADHHARIEIALEDTYLGARHTISLRRPQIGPQGQPGVHERKLEVNIPKGVRPGQHLRLNGQGDAGDGDAPAGDLYLEIAFRPHPMFRIDGADVWFDLPLAPWEAALGASVDAPTPEGDVQLAIPPGSTAGRKLRLKGRGLPGKTPGDLYAVLQIALPKADTDSARAAYAAMAQAFPEFAPRKAHTTSQEASRS
jgi:curved DNA-binding protein